MSGYIYKITSPSGKSYIGQVCEFLKNGDYKGVDNRWKQHCRSAKGKNPEKGCVYLNRAILKYGSENFVVKIIKYAPLDQLDDIETRMISKHKTLVPNGYNLQTGGTYTKHSEETCKKRSESLKKLLESPEKRRIWSDAKKGKQQSKKRNRHKKRDNDLPKYLLHYKSGKYEGYEISYHPLCKSKKFTKSNFTMKEKLNMALEYLRQLNDKMK